MSAIGCIDAARHLPGAVDLLVVGGGPAGAMAAIHAARAGLRTLLVDRTPHPREKVCGCCLAPRGQQALHEAGLGGVLAGARAVHAVRLSCGGRSVRVRREGTAVISRAQLDGGLLRCASEAGVTLAWPFVACLRQGGESTLRGPGGERTVRARMRIAADGLQGSSLRDDPRFAWRVRTGSRVGVGAILSAGSVRLADDEIRMQVGEDGYVGLVQLPDGRVDAAAAVRADAMRARGGAAGCMLHLLGDAVLDREAVHQARWHGTPHLWRRRSRLSDARTLVAGDAAAYVEPFTGEGMGWALATGGAAGLHAVAVLRGEATTASWDDRMRSLTGLARLRCGLAARSLRHPWLVSAAIAAADRWPSLATRVAESLGAPFTPEADPCRA